MKIGPDEGNSGAVIMSNSWKPIDTAPKDGSHVRLYKPEIQFVGYWATGLEKWIINAPDLPTMCPGPTRWKELDWPDET